MGFFIISLLFSISLINIFVSFKCDMIMEFLFLALNSAVQSYKHSRISERILHAFSHLFLVVFSFVKRKSLYGRALKILWCRNHMCCEISAREKHCL